MSQNETVLEVSGLNSSYGAIKAIKDISLHVDKGELVSLLGANGAGKSTLLKSIIGMVHIDSGSVKYEGEEMVGKRSHEIIPKGISIVPEGRKIFADATVMENLILGSYTRATDKTLDEKILEQVFEFFPRLYERKSQMGGTLSGGEQQMLAIGRAMMSDPKLLLLDEPSMGLAPLVVEQVFEVIKKLKETGVTILLVEQNARMAIKVSDRSYMLNTGRIAGELSAKDGIDQNALLEVYLGKSAND
ncbi:ABC transporter ATP-binding protein [Lacrimispora sp.]|uniref:ABC transporter ATP-binding protein n=1 Tax=Lacrimispora sp. TaxID=2719234 RepID=UPI002FD8AFDC